MNNVIFQIEKIPENFTEARYLPVLNREEIFRYKSFSDVLRKRQFLFSRFILKNKLFEVTSKNADEIHFELGPHGKPFIPGKRIQFNISHSENYVGYVISKKEVGIDLQVQREFSNLDGMIKKVCHPNEIEFLTKSAHQESEFLKIWNLKEAYSKCRGSGIQIKFSELDFSKITQENFESENSPTVSTEGRDFEVLFKVLERTSIIYVSVFKELGPSAAQ